MSLLQAAVLAIVQGLTEFLPISSSAHLALIPWLLGWPDQGLVFDIALHFGTLAAVLVYFFRDWVEIVARGFGVARGRDPELEANPRLLWQIALGTLPVVIAGAAFKSSVEHEWRQPWLMGSMLITVGVLMWLGDRLSKREKGLAQISWYDALCIGLAQALALVPGTSRSGITITAGLFCGLRRDAAARFSFLLSTPAVAGAALLAAVELVGAGGIPPGMRSTFLVGVLGSATVGCLSIGLLLRYLRTHSLLFFVAYRLVFGIIVLALAGLFR